MTPIEQGLELMLYGMGTVFVFLTVLVFSVSLLSWLTQRLSRPIGASSSIGVPPARAAGQSVAENDAELFAVIGAAIHRYRSRHKQ